MTQPFQVFFSKLLLSPEADPFGVRMENADAHAQPCITRQHGTYPHKKKKKKKTGGDCIYSSSLSTASHCYCCCCFPQDETLHNQCSIAVQSRRTARRCLLRHRLLRKKSSTQMYPINTCPDGSLTLSPSWSHISHLHIPSPSLICNQPAPLPFMPTLSRGVLVPQWIWGKRGWRECYGVLGFQVGF